MKIFKFIDGFKEKHKAKRTALDFIKYIGPGFLVTIGFIDPGNWVTNISAGSEFGYSLLWIVTIGTLFLIILQHNAAHLGIATGYCLSEAATNYLKPWASRSILTTAMLACISTALAEILGAAIALNMLFGLPIKIGIMIVLGFVMWMLFTNSYKKLERWIIGFVSIIGVSFIVELGLVHVEWDKAVMGMVIPNIPVGSMFILMSVLGAVVMPHNLFLHSEIIQSRQWNLKDEHIIKRQLKYEYIDTVFSMLVGWAINCAIILVAAATFFAANVEVTELSQAQKMLVPLVGNGASTLFAIALLFAGISAAVTAGMAGGSTFAGIFSEPYDINDKHTKLGVGLTLVLATILIFFIDDIFKGLLLSQMFLSVQLPFTIFLQIYLTSSGKVMGKFKNGVFDRLSLWIIGVTVVILNIMLFMDYIL
ncbi:MAG TPA: Mg2+/Co2+ transporter [Clostridiales bacterium]|nr:MAG: Mg2+/Co2+ transporter [Clostridiales bacterium GWD2_32_19]HCC07811.1 Mg2+/Co2+ transporter [Clostridiales bacterium]